MKWAINHSVFNQRTNCFYDNSFKLDEYMKRQNSITKLISFFSFWVLFSSFESVSLMCVFYRFPYSVHIIHTVAFSYELCRHRSNKEFEVKTHEEIIQFLHFNYPSPLTPKHCTSRNVFSLSIWTLKYFSWRWLSNTVMNILQCYLFACVYCQHIVNIIHTYNMVVT